MGERIIWQGSDSNSMTESFAKTLAIWETELIGELESLLMQTQPGAKGGHGSMLPGQMTPQQQEVDSSHSQAQSAAITKSPSATQFTTESGLKSQTQANTKSSSRPSDKRERT